jgi:hypothetical protein
MRCVLGLLTSALLMSALLVAGLHAAAPTAAQAGSSGESAATAVVGVRLRTAIRQLPVRRETRAGYDRDKFRHWVDGDGDCRDTRDEVLAAESRVRVRGCDVARGRWFSYYDHRTWRDSGDVDVDHLVALAEAWDSGARRWTARTRQRFANDLGDRRSLVAVTDNVNMSKSDRDPAEWLPRFGKCTYVNQWTAVKRRWSLRVDRAEKRALMRRARRCANVRLQVRKARVVTRRAGRTRRGGTDPRFDTCAEANDHGYGNYKRGRDREYAWYTDADSDGWVCEF